MKVLGLSSSPRKDGNSQLLTRAVLRGAAEQGHETTFVSLGTVVRGHLRDCTTCRNEGGRCTIEDSYEELFLGAVLEADALVLGTPVYWYGVSGALKTFIDRFFCYISSDFPRSEEARVGLVGKRMALAVSAEERYQGALSGIRGSMQELARYLHWKFVGTVVGIGNQRGEVVRDPAAPIEQALTLGRRMFEIEPTDYRIDSVRSSAVWERTR